MKPKPLEWWQAQRPEVVGKETEKLVEDVLKGWNTSQGFAYMRFADAKAARGLIKAQPADYLFVYNGTTVFLEVKALKHPKRLPKDRVTQLPTLKKFQMAGAECVVLVHHYMEGIWRLVDVSDLEPGVPSWDLSLFQPFASPADALGSLL